METDGEGYTRSPWQAEEKETAQRRGHVAVQDLRSRLQARLYPRGSISGREPASRDNDVEHVQTDVSQCASRTVPDEG